MPNEHIMTEVQKKAIHDFFNICDANGYCEHLDDIFTYSLEVEHNGAENEFFILRQVKKFILAMDPDKK